MFEIETYKIVSQTQSEWGEFVFRNSRSNA